MFLRTGANGSVCGCSCGTLNKFMQIAIEYSLFVKQLAAEMLCIEVWWWWVKWLTSYIFQNWKNFLFSFLLLFSPFECIIVKCSRQRVRHKVYRIYISSVTPSHSLLVSLNARISNSHMLGTVFYIYKCAANGETCPKQQFGRFEIEKWIR